MYVSPNHPDPPRPPNPPEDAGRRLATFSRGPDAEMRISLAEFEGHPFVSLRVWQRDQDGAWWPKRGAGCSVRVSEIPTVLGALRRALLVLSEIQGDDDGQDDRDTPRYVARGRPTRPPWEPDRLRGSKPTEGAEFNEFA